MFHAKFEVSGCSGLEDFGIELFSITLYIHVLAAVRFKLRELCAVGSLPTVTLVRVGACV
jgi:hypothetical protein